MKSMFRMLLCLLVCLLLAAPALADEEEGFYTYHIDVMIGGAVLTRYSGSETNVVVPDTLGGYPVLRLSYGAFHGNTAIESVTLPDSLQYMDGGAFYSNTNLKSVYLPENLIEFHNMGISKSHYFYVDKDSATARLMVGASAYAASFIDPEYPTLTLYYTPSPVTGGIVLAMGKYIGYEETVIIPDGVSHIGDSAFMIGVSGAEENTWTKVVRMPSSVISLGMAAVYSLPNLAEVYLSPNISSWYHTTQPWEAGAFDERSKAKLYCPLDSTTFRTMTPDVTTLGIVDPADPDYAWQNDGKGGRILSKYHGHATKLTIPDYTTQIGDLAFFNNKTLASITIPDSVTYIGSGAFDIDVDDYSNNPDSYAERVIYLPNHAKLGNNPYSTHRTTVFLRHDSETAKELSRLNDEWGWGALYSFIDPRYPDYPIGMYGGEKYMMGYLGSDSVMHIPPIFDVIEGHINLSTPNRDNVIRIVIPEGVTRLKSRALWGWSELQSIQLPSTLREIGEYAFSNTNLPVLIIPDGITHLPAHMADNSIIRYITIPASVTSIDDTAIITSGGMRTYKIYCNKGSYAEKWAKAHSVPVGYLENADYTFYVSEQFTGDIGNTINWRDTIAVAPMEPDFPYTITAKSSNPEIVSVEGDMLSFNAFGRVSLTFSSPELGYSTTIKEVRSYEPVKSFSVPEYVFAKFRSSGTISVSDVVPEKNTDPVYFWHRPEQNDLGGHTAAIESYFMTDVSVPGVFAFTVTSKSGVSRDFTFVHYETINSTEFAPFTSIMGAGMTIEPGITVTVDGIAYENIAATYTLTSSNTKVAKPTADGKLELLTPGTATITAKFINGKTAKQTITVVGENVYTLARGVKVIERETYLNCPVTIMIVPEGYEVIGERAFAGCAQMHRIELPASVTQIAEDAFDDCLPELTVVAPAGSYAERFALAHGLTVLNQ